jgi:thioredoxin-related protein
MDLIANVAVIITSIALLGFLGNSWYTSHHAPQRLQAKAMIGSTVKLPNVDFGQRGKTLLIVISPTCHFCRDSEPFYRELANTASLKTHLLAVLPVSQSEAETYVHASISPSLEIVSASLGQINVQATPTLLLVDSQGKVEKAWVGKLDDASQRQVQSEL